MLYANICRGLVVVFRFEVDAQAPATKRLDHGLSVGHTAVYILMITAAMKSLNVLTELSTANYGPTFT
jgi:hypothetical protein